MENNNKKKRNQEEIDKLFSKKLFYIYFASLVYLIGVIMFMPYLPTDSEGYLDHTQFELIHYFLEASYFILGIILLIFCIHFIIIYKRNKEKKKKIPSFRKWVKNKYPKGSFHWGTVEKLLEQYKKEFITKKDEEVDLKIERKYTDKKF